MHIDIRDVSHDYQTNQGLLPVIKNLSISVKKGGFTAIVGPSGCGKSTITRLVSGLLKPSKGSIFISNEKVISPLSTVGMAFQNPVLLEWRNVINNIILPLEIVSKNLKYNFKRERALELLKLVGLEEFELNIPSELSGGMNKRIAFARALITEPKVVLFDEPTTGLDPERKFTVFDMIKKYRKQFGFSALLVSHDIPDVYEVADSVAWLDKGKVQFFGKPENIDLISEVSIKKYLKTGRISSNHL